MRVTMLHRYADSRVARRRRLPTQTHKMPKPATGAGHEHPAVPGKASAVRSPAFLTSLRFARACFLPRGCLCPSPAVAAVPGRYRCPGKRPFNLERPEPATPTPSPRPGSLGDARDPKEAGASHRKASAGRLCEQPQPGCVDGRRRGCRWNCHRPCKRGKTEARPRRRRRATSGDPAR